MATASTSKLAPIHSMKATTSSPNTDEFIQFRATMRLPIAPCWAADGSAGGSAGQGGMEGVKEVLAGWVMRYLPPLRAVLLTFDPLPTFAHPTESFPASATPFSASRNSASRLLHSDDEEEDDEGPAEGAQKQGKMVKLKVLPMIDGSGFTLANVSFKGMAWRPQVGQRVVGSPTLSTPSHISLLLHNLFNASIPVSHIPLDDYYFDSEYPVPSAVQKRQHLHFVSSGAVAEREAQAEEEEEETEEREAGHEDNDSEAEHVHDLEAEVEREEDQYRQQGWWLHKDSGLPLGGDDGRVKFTIVGMTIANAMISVTGSLLSKPFDEKAAPAAGVSVASEAKVAASRHEKKQRAKKRPRHDEDDNSIVDPEADTSDSSRSPSPERLAAPPSVRKAPASVASSVSGDEDNVALEDLKPKKGKKDKKEKKKSNDKKEAKRAEKKAKKA